MASMYICIRDDLKKRNLDVVTYTFHYLNELIASQDPSKTLPKSAYKHKRWWNNNDPHTQCTAWESAGYKVDHSKLDLGKSVTFIRS